MATLKQKLSRAADKGLNKANEYVDDARRGKQRLESRYDDADIGGRIEEFAENTGHTLRQAYESSTDRLDEATERTRDMVQSNPLLAIAGAFVGGMFASMLLRK